MTTPGRTKPKKVSGAQEHTTIPRPRSTSKALSPTAMKAIRKSSLDKSEGKSSCRATKTSQTKNIHPTVTIDLPIFIDQKNLAANNVVAANSYPAASTLDIQHQIVGAGVFATDI